MSAASDQALAGQLMALLDGDTVRDAGDEALTLAGFARRLPWPVPRLSTTFRTGLRGKLVGRPARTRLPFAGFSLGAYVGMAAVIAVAVISGLVLLGPRISGVFGTVFNSLDSPSVGYDRQYDSGGSAPALRPTSVPAPQHGPAPSLAPVAREPGAGALPDDAAPANAAPAGHLIIKNAQVVMLVEDTDTAITRLTAIAAQYGGYILNSQSWYDEGYKEATVVLSVPAEYFEQALNRVREVATRVEQEAASGEDVTDQYVDLESQLRNLEATAERLRAFLGMAATVTEALRVNDELAGIEGQVEQVKGRMNYLAGRAAYSTISVDLRPPRPTPTPTPAPTVTPTPAPTPTPTPVVWQPGKTAERATNVLGAIGRFVVEALIWVGLVVLPVVGVPVLLFLAIGWAVGKVGRKAGQE